MEDGILSSENLVLTGEAENVSNTSPHLTDSSPSLANLQPVQLNISGVQETKQDVLDKMDIDNHNVTMKNAVSSDILESNSLPNESVSELSDTTDPNSSLIEELKSVNVSPQITPGKSRYGRIRRPKLMIDFVSVDKKSYAVLNSSSYDIVFADESQPSKTSITKKKRSYLRKSIVSSEDSTPAATPRGSKLKSKKEKPELAEEDLKTEVSISKSDVYPIDESSMSSLSSINVKTYSRKSEASISSDEKQSGIEENTRNDAIPMNYTELNWKVGDVAWAKIGCYPYWPSIVTLEYGSSIYVKSVGKRGSRLAVHVQFFGDRGRRSWVLTTSLIKYKSKEQFMELKRQYSKDKLRMKYFNIIRTKELWEKAISEADTILKLPHEERIKYYQSIYPVSEETYAAEIATNAIKGMTVRRIRKNPEERRGRKRKILDDRENRGSVKKRRRLENLNPRDASSRSKGFGRMLKRSRKPMDEHLRKRRAFERRLNKIMKQSIARENMKANIKNGQKLQNLKNVKFDELVRGEKLVKSSGTSSTVKTEKKDALSVYDFESDEETDIFLGTYNSRYTPHILTKIEEMKDNEDENRRVANDVVENNTIEHELSNEGVPNEKREREEDVDIDVNSSVKNEEKTVNIEVENKPKRGRGRPKGSKNIKTLLRLEKMKGRARLITSRTHKKLTLRQRKRAMLNVERKILQKNQVSETADINDSNSERRKKVHPKKRLLEKSRRSEKNSRMLSAENADENDKALSGENEKLSKRSLSMSPKEDLDSDDDDLKVIRADRDEDKRRSSSPPTLPACRSKKSSALFGGFKFEKVCLICEKPGDTVRCRGPCSGTYHIECVTQTEKVDVKVVENVLPCKPRRGRPPRASYINLVSANESEEAKILVESFSDSRGSQPDQAAVAEVVNDVNNEERCSIASTECIVTKAVEHNAAEANDSSLLLSADSIDKLKSVDAKIVASNDDETSVDVSEERNAVIEENSVSIPSPNSMKFNGHDHFVNVLPVAELIDSVIKSDEREKLLSTVVINGHCELSMSCDKNFDDQVPENPSSCDTSASHRIKKEPVSFDVEANHMINREPDGCNSNTNHQLKNEFKNHNADMNHQVLNEPVSSSTNADNQTEEKPDSCCTNVGNQVEEKHKNFQTDVSLQIRGELVSCEASVNDQVKKEGENDSAVAIYRIEEEPDSSSANANSRVEGKNNNAGAIDRIDEEPDSSSANAKNRFEENENSNVDVNDQMEPDSFCINLNNQVEKVSDCNDVNINNQVENEPVTLSADANQQMEEELENCVASVNDQVKREPISSSKNVDNRVERENEINANYKMKNASENNVEKVNCQFEEGSKSCDKNSSRQVEDKTESRAAAENKVEEENISDVAMDEETSVPVCSVENEEAGSSDACSENLSCSTKTDSSNGVDFRCIKCTENKMYPCFSCGKEVQEKTGETERYACYLASCGRVYHKECLKAWPQATWRGNNSSRLMRNSSSVSRNAGISKETLMCPQHYCHTCISENPAVQKNKQCNEILIRCIRCPTAYHKRVHCIPAGTEILTMSQIICPRHYEPPIGPKNTIHFNTSWCFICCIGGSLICCDECPTSFHAECLQLRPEEYEGRYICDDCQSGRYLLYGEIAWIKLGHYRWWPAKILFPNEVPENIQNLPHRRGEFVVEFYGSHDYNWVNRGRAFLYHEGDSGKKGCRRNAVDLSFEKAIQEAEEAYEKLKVVKAARDEEARVGLKPPRYVHIKANKPVGNVRIVELNTSNITACECDPKSERPCGPDSDCINRMLLVECNPLICPAGDRCNNQAFETRVYPPLMPYKTDKRGWGLKTLVNMKKGDFIIEYVGEMIDEEEYKRRVNIMHKNQEDNYYFLTIDKDRMLDAGPKGNVARFMNHSCDPNCETQKWTVNGDTRVGLFAVKNIPADTELVFNYNLATQGNERKPCFCGSDKCSGFIGVKATKNGVSSIDEEVRKRSNEENGTEPRKKRRRGRRKKIVRTRISASKGGQKEASAILLRPKKLLKEKKKVGRPLGKWKVDARFKSKARGRVSVKKNVESLLKHREQQKQRKIGERAKFLVQKKTKTKKVEQRGRKKMPKTEEEKQALLFEMMRKRIQRKIEEMTFRKLDEQCFICGEMQGEEKLLFCDNNKCPKGYHRQCLKLTKWPSGRWLCPWHYCTVCRSIRKVLKCEKCINSYCYLHVSENLSKADGNHYLCKVHQSNSVSSLPAPSLDEEMKVEMTNARSNSPPSIADTATGAPTVVKRPRGRPKGSKSRHLKTADNSHSVAVKTKRTSSSTTSVPTNAAKSNSISASSKKTAKLKRKIVHKKRQARDLKLAKWKKTKKAAAAVVAVRKKNDVVGEKKRLQTGDVDAVTSKKAASSGGKGGGDRRPNKAVVETSIKFSHLNSGGDGDDVKTTPDRGTAVVEMAMAVDDSPTTTTNVADSDESFSSFVTSEVMIVDELTEAAGNTSKEDNSELSEKVVSLDTTVTNDDAEISDGEYDNLEVEVINGDDSN